jgi:hypothetical protein
MQTKSAPEGAPERAVQQFDRSTSEKNQTKKRLRLPFDAWGRS